MMDEFNTTVTENIDMAINRKRITNVIEGSFSTFI